jgi:hypothetical protein
MEQRAAEQLLQPPDLLAHGRLGAVNALARAGEAAGVNNRDEAAEQVEIEHGYIIYNFNVFDLII